MLQYEAQKETFEYNNYYFNFNINNNSIDVMLLCYTFNIVQFK